jgi:acyl transferase domain-containing protein
MSTAPAPVAVVGLDCRFPGAADPAAFWRLLLEGRGATGPVPPDRWDPHAHAGEPPGVGTPAGFIDDAAAFDSDFFGLSPSEAAAMDPQQRLLLQTAWRAVEDAGTDPRSLAGTATSVHVGMMSSEWGTLHLGDHRAMTAHRGSGNGYCMSANRISYHLDLKGPSMAVDTACSSSLVATHLACTALRAGEADTALAAGVNLILTPALSVFYAQAGLAAPDGRCKPFADSADGIGRGEGVGVVVLMRLEDALREKRRVYAVIEGGAVGSDGRSNGLTAPNRFAQADVMRSALRRSGVAAHDLHFVEGHGTGTRLGDRIEVRALGDLHAGRPRPALLGSVKGNVGHLEGAAGIAGLIKACLALERRTLPPTLGGQENPELALAGHGLRLAGSATRLPGGDLHAAVSSFGLGGTNAHLVLSAPPRRRTRGGPPGDALVVAVGGDTREALRRNAVAARRALATEPEARAGQFAWTSTTVKTGLRLRAAVAGTGRDQLLAGLDALAAQGVDGPPVRRRTRPRVVLAFTGQGSQYPAMTRELHRHCPPYRRHLRDASDAVGKLGDGSSVLDLLTAEGPPAALEATGSAQPALFAVGYAMAATLCDLGLEPVALLGHSVGEFAAACVAGVLSLEDAARLVAARGALMQALPAGGSMLAVRAGEEELAAVLGPGLGAAPGEVLDVAAVNGPRATTLSGDTAALDRAAAALGAAGVRTTALRVSHAFHSALMRPAAEGLAEVAARVTHRPAAVPVASTVRDDPDPVFDAGYWAEQLCAPVRFAAAAARIAALGPTHVVEAGPRPVLLGLLRDQLGPHTALACGPGPGEDGSELAAVVAALHRDGFDPDWSRWFAPAHQELRPVPGHVFDTSRRYWFTPGATPAAPAAASAPATGPAPAAVPAPAAQPVVAVPAGTVADVVREALTSVGGQDASRLHAEARLDDDLGFDSIMVMRLADLLEPRFGRLDLEALLPHLTTVGALVTHLEGVHAAPARHVPQGVAS